MSELERETFKGGGGRFRGAGGSAGGSAGDSAHPVRDALLTGGLMAAVTFWVLSGSKHRLLYAAGAGAALGGASYGVSQAFAKISGTRAS